MLHLFLVPLFINICNCCPQKLFSSLEVWQIVSFYISSYKSNSISLPSSYIIFSKQTLFIPMPSYLPYTLPSLLQSIKNINHNFIIHKRNILDPPKLLPFLFSPCFSTPLMDTLLHQLVYRAYTSQGIQLHPKFHHHHHHNKDKPMCTKIVLLNMTKLQQNTSNNILSIRSENYVLPATITLKPITHLLVLMLIGGNVGDSGEQGKRECFCYFPSITNFIS
jgi:hypothetical protein